MLVYLSDRDVFVSVHVTTLFFQTRVS